MTRYSRDIPMALVPTVVEQTHRGERGWDIFSRKRNALPNARVMIHQPLAGVRGQVSDIEIHAREVLRARDTINALYAQHTGQSVDRIARDTERDNFMSAAEAKAYGLIDEVLLRKG